MIFAGTRGYLDPIAVVSVIASSSRTCCGCCATGHADILERSAREKALGGTEKKLVAFLDKFAKGFAA